MRTISFAKIIFVTFFLLWISSSEALASDVYKPGIATSSNSSGVVGGGGSGGSYTYYVLRDASDREIRSIPNNLDFNLVAPITLEKIANLFQARKANLFKDKEITKYFLAPCRDKITRAKCPLWVKKGSARSAGGSGYPHIKLSWGPGGRTNNRGSDAIAAYSLRIWRENAATGEMDLILDRSVEGNGQELRSGDTWQVPASTNWWRRGMGRLYTSGKRVAGPIGANYAPLERDCSYSRSNPGRGSRGGSDINIINPSRRNTVYTSLIPRDARFQEEWGKTFKVSGACYWEGPSLGEGNNFVWRGPVFNWIRRNGVPTSVRNQLRNDQFGVSRSWYINRQGMAGTGLREAVYMKWHIPSNRGKAYLRVRILGAPGHVYAVHQAALNERMQIKKQKFSAYIANKRPVRDIPNPRGKLLVRKIGSGSGVVKSSSNPYQNEQIDCGSRCFQEFAENAWVTLTPRANSGSAFSGWSGCDISRDSLCQVKMTEGKVVIASFNDVSPPPGTLPDWRPPDVELDLEYPEVTSVQKEETITSKLRVVDPSENISPEVGADDEALTESQLDDIVGGENNPSAAVFPTARNFFHYTPQARYSEQANYKEAGYALYGTDSALALPISNQGIAANPTKANEKIMRIGVTETSSAIIDQADEVSGSVQITWQKPTLQNPCLPAPTTEALAPNYDNRSGAWPNNPRTGVGDCDGDNQLFNAWDDLLIGEAIYDEVYQGNINTESGQPGAATSVQYKKFPLRCRTGFSGQPDESQVQPPVFPGGDCQSDRKQLSQDLPVAGRFAPVVDEENPSPARIVLDSSSPVELSVSDESATVTGSLNPLTNKMEINLCQRGRAINSKPYNMITGDPDCLSPVVRWDWSNNASNCRIGNSVPPFNAFVRGGAANADTVGTAGTTREKRIRDTYFSGTWPEDLPYRGILPGSGVNEESMRCAWRWKYSNVVNQTLKVSVRTSPAAGYELYQVSSGQNGWCRTRDGATWLEKSTGTARPSGTGWRKPCYYKWSWTPSAPAEWDVLATDSVCSLSGGGYNLEVRDDPPGPPSRRCYYSRNKEWAFKANAPDNWAENWNGRGYVIKGYWRLDPLRSPGANFPNIPSTDIEYVGPGYVQNSGPRIGSDEDSALLAKNGVSVTGKSNAPWGLSASFNTYMNLPYFYSGGNRVSAEGYVTVSAPRVSG